MRLLEALPRFVFFTGKGGVGKTSLACATAVRLAANGESVLLVSTDPASNVGQVLGQRIGNMVTAVDGTWGLGMSTYGRPVATIVNEHLGPLLVGEECLAVERAWDLMTRAASPYSPAGLASYAISAIDLALWDLKGKLLGRPVYEPLGGPARDRIFCYATGNDTDWHMELGFSATKLACPFGPADGVAGIDGDEELVARTRELIGPKVELMLDCWMAFDPEFTVRLAERLKPYGLRWIEDCLMPDDLDGWDVLRRRLPWQTLATGEHWYGLAPFLSSISRRNSASCSSSRSSRRRPARTTSLALL